MRDRALAAPLDAVVPVWRELSSDTETPVAAFLKLRRGGTACLLESAEQDGQLGRYSFIGVDSDALLRADVDRGTVTAENEITAYYGTPISAVRRLAGSSTVFREDADAADLPGFLGGAIGAVGYDFARTLERLPARLTDNTGFPVAVFARYHTLCIFDHRRGRLLVTSLMPPASDRNARIEDVRRAEGRIAGILDRLSRGSAAPALDAPLRLRGSNAGSASDVSRLTDARPDRCERVPDDATFLESVRRAVELIHAGEAIQVVLSRRLTVPFPGDAFGLYRALRAVSPAPYMFFLEFPDVALVGSSPEMLLRVEKGAAQLSPIAGTRRRGADAEEDASLEAELASDEKERAEHVMLVDLARNDLGRVCEIGSVRVPRMMQVERFSHVMHLVSLVTGKLRANVDSLDAFAACFPAGTVSGAPKVRAMELIEELETVRRGAYAGAVVNLSPGAQEIDTCITIRTVVLRRGRAYVQTGAGIVADSVPETELAETDAKAGAMMAALERAGVFL